MEVRWSTPAVEHLERIFARIEKDNPTAAGEVAKTIYDGCEALRDFPRWGWRGRMEGRRELVFAPYIVVYRVTRYAVEMSRIYHGARDWP